MLEQRALLEAMLARAELSVKELGERLGRLQAEQDAVGLEGAILEAVLGLGVAWLGLVLSAWACDLAAAAGTRRECVCGGVARWVGLRAKTILTLLGRVSYSRVYFHCDKCHHGETLGDQTWGLKATRTSPALKHLLAYLGATTVGFATVAQNVCRTLHWPEGWLSGKQVQRLVEPVGSQVNDLEMAKVEGWWAKLAAGLAAELALPTSPTPTGESRGESRGTRGGSRGESRARVRPRGLGASTSRWTGSSRGCEALRAGGATTGGR